MHAQTHSLIITVLLTGALAACGGDGKHSGGTGETGDGGTNTGGSANGGSGGSGASGGSAGTAGSSTGGGGSSSGGSAAGGTSGGGTGGGSGGGGSGGGGTGGGGSGGGGSGGGGTGGGGSGGGGTGGGGSGGGGTCGFPEGFDSPGEGGASGLDLEVTVSPDQDHLAISPNIYGMNRVDAASSAGAKLVRVGGEVANHVSGYNWEVNATHLGDRQGFVNSPLGEGTTPGDASNSVIQTAQANDGTAMLVVPMGDRVAADSVGDDVRDTTDYLDTRFDANERIKGSTLSTDPDTSDGVVYQDEFVNWARVQAGSTPVVFALDNHPSLWDLEFSLIHPDKPSYSEFANLSIDYALMIKSTFPEATISGPAAYGWQAYINFQGSEDYDTEGDFLEYYLSQMQVAETDNSERLLDYLDIHWWPEARACGKRVIAETSEPGLAVARMQAPRSLWDATYLEDSWIVGGSGNPVRLIPKMQARIDDNYPGTQLAFGAWYYGGGSDISGAIAAADALGIFGRYGIGLASVSLPNEAPYVTAAFRAFLDYDGAGAHFGDTSVAAVTDDLEGASVHASIESASQDEVVIVLLNKRNVARNATINVASNTVYDTCAVYELTDQGPNLSEASSLSSSAENTFEYRMPPISLAVLVPHVSD